MSYVPAGPMQARLRRLVDRHGVAFQHISERTGVSTRVLLEHYRGQRFGEDAPLARCQEATADLILGTQFTTADVDRAHPVGVRRRLQALARAGFTSPMIEDETGINWQHLHALTVGRKGRTHVSPETARRVSEAYERMHLRDPVKDYGGQPQSCSRVRMIAERRGYAPHTCWDSDTLGDPEAFPEWTGACGTARGRRIHAREGIPECQACRDRVLDPTTGFQSATFRALRLERGWSQPQLGDRIGCARESIAGWENGRTNPRESIVPAILSAFGVDRTVLFKEE